MKKFFSICVALLLPAVLFAQGEDSRALWRFSKKKSKAANHYIQTGVYPAVMGIKDAELTFRHKGRIVKSELSEKGYPTALSAKGDYWLFEVPVKGLQEGTVIDAFIPFTGNKNERNNFVLEYRDGRRWVEAAQALSTTSHSHPLRLWHSVRLSRSVKSGKTVALRLRQLDEGAVQSTIVCPSSRGQQPQIVIYDNAVARDTLRMLFIGNSYTYYHTYPMIFKEIAWREGHYAECDLFVSGGYTMERHLMNSHCMEYVNKGGYDYVMLQDQSILPTLNGTDDDAGSSAEMGEMVTKVRKRSPKARVAIEITWGRRYGSNNFGKYERYIEKYPHFYADYDAMQNRLIEVLSEEAQIWSTEIHPLGYAWQIVMHERPDIMLYHTDNHHQSYAGSYLSAAVAYLTVYGEKFGSNPANCALDAETAEYLRSVAERVVLGGEKWMGK